MNLGLVWVVVMLWWAGPAVPAAPPVVPSPVYARIVHVELQYNTPIATVDRGSADGVDRNWHAALVDQRGRVTKPATVIRVDKHTVIVKVKATLDDIHASPRIKLWTDPPVEPEEDDLAPP